jgi:tetratricopeptide (TPR) repeat protein
MYCSKCKSKFPNNYLYCGLCGSKLIDDRQIIEGKEIDEPSVLKTPVLKKPLGRCSRRALGRILDTKELLEVAVRKFKEAQKKYPNYADIYFDLGVIYRGQERFEDAVEELQKCININPNYRYAKEALENLENLKND